MHPEVHPTQLAMTLTLGLHRARPNSVEPQLRPVVRNVSMLVWVQHQRRLAFIFGHGASQKLATGNTSVLSLRQTHKHLGQRHIDLPEAAAAKLRQLLAAGHHGDVARGADQTEPGQR